MLLSYCLHFRAKLFFFGFLFCKGEASVWVQSSLEACVRPLNHFSFFLAHIHHILNKLINLGTLYIINFSFYKTFDKRAENRRYSTFVNNKNNNLICNLWPWLTNYQLVLFKTFPENWASKPSFLLWYWQRLKFFFLE